MVDEKIVERLNKFCGVAEGDLDTLKDRLKKIIDAKKKLSSKGGKDDLMLRQVGDVLVAIENLEKINLELPGAIKEIKDLCYKIHLLLGPRVDLQKGPPDPSKKE